MDRCIFNPWNITQAKKEDENSEKYAKHTCLACRNKVGKDRHVIFIKNYLPSIK